VVNDSFRLGPFADALYACDGDWWDHWWQPGCPSGASAFVGQKWSQDARAAETYGINRVPSVAELGLSLDPLRIHLGSNSGYQALNLAVLFGASRILLTGFDMKLSVGGQRHFFGDHPGSLNKASDYNQFIRAFHTTADDLKRAGVEVLNCTPGSALDAFPMAKLEDVI